MGTCWLIKCDGELRKKVRGEWEGMREAMGNGEREGGFMRDVIGGKRRKFMGGMGRRG